MSAEPAFVALTPIKRLNAPSDATSPATPGSWLASGRRMYNFTKVPQFTLDACNCVTSHQQHRHRLQQLLGNERGLARFVGQVHVHGWCRTARVLTVHTSKSRIVGHRLVRPLPTTLYGERELRLPSAVVVRSRFVETCLPCAAREPTKMPTRIPFHHNVRRLRSYSTDASFASDRLCIDGVVGGPLH